MSQAHKNKVYFSISNASDPIFAAKVRKRLEALDIEIVEYSGYGTYNPQPMMDCETLIILPPPRTYDATCHWKYNVGRGQYDQVKMYLQSHDQSDVFIVNSCDDQDHDKNLLGLYIDMLENVRTIDLDWKTKYGVLEGESCEVDITEYYSLKKIEKPKTVEPKSVFDPSYPSLSQPWPNSLTEQLKAAGNKFHEEEEKRLAKNQREYEDSMLDGFVIKPSKQEDECGMPYKDSCANYIPKNVQVTPNKSNTNKVLPMLAVAYLLGLA